MTKRDSSFTCGAKEMTRRDFVYGTSAAAGAMCLVQTPAYAENTRASAACTKAETPLPQGRVFSMRPDHMVGALDQQLSQIPVAGRLCCIN